jgi:xylan 1,4-beta-xylosidase
MRKSKIFALVLALQTLLIFVNAKINIPRACTGEHANYKFCDSNLSMDERVKDLISRLNDTEKPYLLTARESPKGSIPRLGIPEYDWGGNCIHGVQSRCGSNFTRCPTSFPDPIFLGATFNQSAWRGMGSVIGKEIRSLWLQNVGEDHQSNLPHIGLDCWSPNINIVRDARWGRNLETPGEDPLVNGLYGAMYTLGLQNGDDPRFLQAVTTLKHYDANSLEGTWDTDGKYDLKNGTLNRHSFNAIISKYDLASTYLPAFRRSVVQGGAKGVMCSYNEVNGIPSCANSLLLKDLLRDTWGFDGYVTSDSGAVTDINQNHHYCKDLTCSVGAALSNGCDVESAPWPPNHPWGTGSPYIKYTGDAIKKKLMTEDDLNTALYHALMIRFRLGLFDPIDDQPYWHVDPEVVRSKEHTDLAMDTTLQGFVLLKNGDAKSDPILPIDLTLTTAVIGPLAKAQGDLLGNYIGQICPGTDINDVSCVTSPYDAIQSMVGDRGKVTYAAGLENIKSTDKSGFNDAVNAAKNADQAILFVGLDGSVEREGQDRENITLPGIQSELAKAIIAANPKTVVVLINGGMVAIDELKAEKNVAIIEAFYPGFYGAEALARAVFGFSNRWGKLPATVYDNTYTKRFNMLDFEMAPHGDQPGRTYRYGGGVDGVLYPFGYGLSYTSFKLAFDKDHKHNDKELVLVGDTTLHFTAENTGDREGDTVVMGFFTPNEFSIDNPTSELASSLKFELFTFQRLSLNAGEKIDLMFTVNPKTLMVYDANGNGVSIPGKYTITITENGINDERALKMNVTIPGTEKKILQPFLKTGVDKKK